MAEKIILEWVGDPTGLKPVADALKSIGALSAEQQAKFEAANNAFKQRSAEINKQTSEQKLLNAETGKGAKSVEDLANKTKDLPKNIRQAQVATESMGRSMANVGRQIAAAFGVVTLIASLVMAFKQMISVNADFEYQMAKVKAATGATGAEFAKLEKNALMLGASTKFTAAQVGELQEAFGKLGFSTKEILNATEATLTLAEATGSDLATAADVAGSTVRAFQLDASETQRVVDVMAKSFSSSALGMENFAEAMKYVAPVANAANIDLETTTALLGKLADSGLRGSIAGTGLKNLISKLSDENSELSKELGFSVKNSEDLIKAFQKLAKGNIDLTKATELTDERSKAAFITLINGIDGVESLADALKNAGGSAEEMAMIMRDTFTGDVDEAASAWEGLLLAMKSTDSARGFVQGLTNVLGGLTIVIQKLRGEWDQIKEDEGMAAAFKSGEKRAAKFKQVMEQSVGDQGKLLKVLEEEIERASGTYDQMLLKQNEYLDLADKQQEKIDGLSAIQITPPSWKFAVKAFKDLAQAEEEGMEGLIAYMDALDTYAESIRAGGGANDSTEKFIRSIETLQEQLKKFKETFTESEIGSAKWIKSLGDMELKNRELAEAQKLATEELLKFKAANDLLPADAHVNTFSEMQSQFDSAEGLREEARQNGEAMINHMADLSRIKANDEIDREEGRAVRLFDIETDRIDATIKLYEKLGIDSTALRLQQSERFAKLNDEERQSYQKLIDDLDEMDRERDAKKKADFIKAVEMTAELATGIFSRMTEIQNNALDYEMQVLEKRLEKGEITREYYEERRAAAQQKQATNNKANALFSAIINTAVAVTKALSEENYAMAIIAGILGGLEIASIASQPIPQFAKGTKDAPAGFKWVGERGAELIHDGGGYPIITHRESRIISEDPYSAAALRIRKKYDIPDLDVGLFGNNMRFSDRVNRAQGSRDGLDYDKLGKTLAENLMGKNRELLRSMEKSRELDRAIGSAMIEVMQNNKPKRRGYAT